MIAGAVAAEVEAARGEFDDDVLCEEAAAPRLIINFLLTLVLTMILSKSGENIVLNGTDSKLLKGSEAINFISNHINKQIKDNYISAPNIDEIKNNSHVILIGDFLNNLADTKKVIKQLSDRGINGIIIHIVDPAEKSFPYKGRINFNGLEEEQNILIGKAESVRSQYKKAIKLHFDNLENNQYKLWNLIQFNLWYENL